MPLHSAASIPCKVPKEYAKVVNELDFLCPSCTSADPNGTRIYHKLKDALLQPISGPKDCYTRIGVICPDCSCVAGDSFYITGGIADLEKVPLSYKRPKRGPNANRGGFTSDPDEEAPKFEPIQKKRRGPQKKETDLSPKTRGRKPKGAEKAAQEE